MFRKSALAMAMLGALTTGQVVALGLGEIQLESALNQPLQAEVELLSATPAELNELKVAIGSSQAFEAAGIERPLFLTKLKFDVSRNAQGNPVVRITSRDVVREPFLDFLLEVSWSKGKLLREYTVLVDPPVTMPASPPAPRTPPTQATSVTAPSLPAAPARRVTHTALMPPLSVSPSEYQTRRNDTLWQVAQQVRPDRAVSMEQTMLALLRTNPEAFTDNNINNLKAGYVLRVPDRAEMTSISKAQALSESRAQYAAWREAQGQPVTQPEAASQATAPGDAQVAPDGGGHLQLVAPELSEPGATGGAVEQGSKLDAIQRDLMIANEALETERRRGDELSGRLAVLEEQIRNMQRLIQLKDDELAQLQSQASDSTSEPVAEALAPGADASASMLAEDLGAEATSAAVEQADAVGETTLAETPPESESAAEVPGTESAVAGSDPEGLPAETPVPEAAEASQATAPEPALPTPPAQPPVAPVTATTPGFVDQLLANPLWLGAGAVVLALLAFFGLRRKRSVESGFQESILQASQEQAPARAEGGFKSASAQGSGDSNATSLLSEFAVSDMGSLNHGGEADPLAEADVYLAYGRFQQAEDLIREALEDAPEDEELNLKLLEVHLASKNQSAFDEHAQAVLARLENNSDPLWEKVAEMGRELSPENPLYQAGSAAPADASQADDGEDFAEEAGFDVLEPGIDAETPAADEFEAPAASDDQDRGLDFDIDLSPESGEAAAADAPDSVEFTPPEVSSDLAFDMDSVEPDAVEQDNGLDFDLEDFDVAGEEELAEQEGDGELTDLDEVSTKLDLARAYIDMGDPDGARNILDEVMEEGSEDQKSEAQGIMQQIS